MLMLSLIGFVVLVHIFVNIFSPYSSNGSFSHSKIECFSSSSSFSSSTTTFSNTSVCAVSATPLLFDGDTCSLIIPVFIGADNGTGKIIAVYPTPGLFEVDLYSRALLSDHGQSKDLINFDLTGNAPVKIYYSKLLIYALVICGFVIIVKRNEAAKAKALFARYEPNEADRIFCDELVGLNNEIYDVSELSDNETGDNNFKYEDFVDIADYIDEKDANDLLDPVTDDDRWIKKIKEMCQNEGNKYEKPGHSSDITKGLYLTIKNDQELVKKKVVEYRKIVSDCFEHVQCFQDAVVAGHNRTADLTVQVLEERANHVTQRKNYLIEIFRARFAGNDADVSDNEDFDDKFSEVRTSGNVHMFNKSPVVYEKRPFKYAYFDDKYDENSQNLDYDADRSLIDEFSDSDFDD